MRSDDAPHMNGSLYGWSDVQRLLTSNETDLHFTASIILDILDLLQAVRPRKDEGRRGE